MVSIPASVAEDLALITAWNKLEKTQPATALTNPENWLCGASRNLAKGSQKKLDKCIKRVGQQSKSACAFIKILLKNSNL